MDKEELAKLKTADPEIFPQGWGPAHQCPIQLDIKAGMRLRSEAGMSTHFTVGVKPEHPKDSTIEIYISSTGPGGVAAGIENYPFDIRIRYGENGAIIEAWKRHEELVLKYHLGVDTHLEPSEEDRIRSAPDSAYDPDD